MVPRGAYRHRDGSLVLARARAGPFGRQAQPAPELAVHMEPEPEPEPAADDAAVVPILKSAAGAQAAALAAGQRVVWNEENLLQNEAERPEGGYMKIDEPDTPFEYTVQPVSDSESDEEGDSSSGSSGGGPSPPPVALGFSESSFAAAFEAKRHTVVQGVAGDEEEDGEEEDAGGTGDAASEAVPQSSSPEPDPPPEPEPEPEPQTAVDEEVQYEEVTAVPGRFGDAPGDAPERFTAMEAAEAAKFKKERSAHYNEYEKMQEYKRKLAAGELTEDDY
jgi:hypothetical protein